MLEINKIHNINALDGLKQITDNSINCSISSPPYWALRSYLKSDDINKKYELGQEPFFKDYISNLIEIYKEVYRVLRPDGCCFVNLGDTYGLNSKQPTNTGSLFDGKKFNQKEIASKSLCNIPYRFAIKMTDDIGWIHRNLIIWHKPNVFPTSSTDRFTVDFEPILFFTKSKKYDFRQQIEPFAESSKPNEIYTGQATKDYESQGAQNPSDAKRRILEGMRKRGGRNKRCVWNIKVKPSKDEHTATFNEELINPMILSGSPENGIVLDPFAGTNTTGLASLKLKRNFISLELSQIFCKIGEERVSKFLQEKL